MIEHAGINRDSHIISKCVKNLHAFFPGNEKAKRRNESRRWRIRDKTMGIKKESKLDSNLNLSSI